MVTVKCRFGECGPYVERCDWVVRVIALCFVSKPSSWKLVESVEGRSLDKNACVESSQGMLS